LLPETDHSTPHAHLRVRHCRTVSPSALKSGAAFGPAALQATSDGTSVAFSQTDEPERPINTIATRSVLRASSPDSEENK